MLLSLKFEGDYYEKKRCTSLAQKKYTKEPLKT
jgi:hypothetical protein